MIISIKIVLLTIQENQRKDNKRLLKYASNGVSDEILAEKLKFKMLPKGGELHTYLIWF
jgi:hypothetical protein